MTNKLINKKLSNDKITYIKLLNAKVKTVQKSNAKYYIVDVLGKRE